MDNEITLEEYKELICLKERVKAAIRMASLNRWCEAKDILYMIGTEEAQEAIEKMSRLQMPSGGVRDEED